MKILDQVLLLHFKMNIIHLIFMAEFVFVKGGNDGSAVLTGSSENGATSSYQTRSDQQSNFPSLPLNHLKIGINSDNDQIQHVNLVQTNRVLANEHLSIWILRGALITGDLHLERNYEVMNQLGKFTFYQEAKTSSAAVYFHKRREFDGMIGYEFLMQKLSIDRIHLTGETLLSLEEPGLYRRPDYDGHSFEYFDADAGNTVGVNYQGYMKTYEGHIYNGYPEILVIVSWSVAKYWTQTVEEADHYTTIVSRVLTLFNGVDMLYSKLKNTNIQINIAGIIIGTTKYMFSALRECYRSQPISNTQMAHKLDGPCVNSILTNLLRASKDEIPLHSYDSVIYLTRINLYRMITDVENNIISMRRVTGTSRCELALYNSKKRDEQFIPIASITTKRYLDNYHVIAHEMAHLMTVLHDDAPYFTEDEKCSGYLMRPNSNCCANCLSWSEMSETTFKLFFSSPNCCSFINKPPSFNPLGQQTKLTADEQCQCYGYKFAMMFNVAPENFCQIKLQCKDADNVIHDTVTPMDGTLCDYNKICWQMKCQETDMNNHHYWLYYNSRK